MRPEHFILAAVMAMLTVTASPAGAQQRQQTGEDMAAACKVIATNVAPAADIAFRAGICLGTIDALGWTASTMPSETIRSCVTAETTRQQMATVVTAYLEQHPDELREPFQGLVLEALAQAWPCTQSQSWLEKLVKWLTPSD